MGNFKVGEIIENNCNNGQGICCANCQYLCDTDKWKACSESCLADIKIKDRSCLECKHQPKWMVQMDKCKKCIKINECEFDVTEGKECKEYEEVKEGKENE